MKVITEITSTLHRRVSSASNTSTTNLCRRFLNKKAGVREGRRLVMRKDQTDKHNELIETDRDDKHRYFKWNYQPLPTQTILDEVNPQFAIRSPEFKLPNPRGRLARSVWRQRIAEVQAARHDPELEKLARYRKLILPLDQIEAEWRTEFAIHDVNKLIRFNNISSDLFKADDVIMETLLDVAFTDVLIHRGNLVKPAQLALPPNEITFDSKQGCYFTLIVSNLDGHPTGSGNEVVHWIVSNIQDGKLSSGNTILNYLAPLPWKGTGYHRITFTLYRQNSGPIEAKVIDGSTLKGRCFDSSGFGSTHDLQPIGISWCQADWDESVSHTATSLKDLSSEPIFDWEEYLEPKEEQKVLLEKLKELKFRNM